MTHRRLLLTKMQQKAITEAGAEIEAVRDAVAAAFEERSEAWQSSDAGQDAAELIDALDKAMMQIGILKVEAGCK